MQGIKIHIKRKRKEFGIRKKRILFGKKIKKITKPESKIKVRKLIKNGKKDQNYTFLKQDSFKINNKSIKQLKIGLNVVNLGMDGDKIKLIKEKD